MAICGIFYNNHDNLRDWLSYHQWIGINKFYIFDHGSSPPLLDYIEDFVSTNLVEYHYFTSTMAIDYVENTPRSPGAWVQDRCFQWYGHRHRFLGLFDSNEYLVVTNGKAQDIESVLKPFEQYRGLAVYWQMFLNGSTAANTSALAAHSSYVDRDEMMGWKEFQSNPLMFTKSIVNTAAYGAAGCSSGNCSSSSASVRNTFFVNTQGRKIKDPAVARSPPWEKLVLYRYPLHEDPWLQLLNSRRTNATTDHGTALHNNCCRHSRSTEDGD